jgi:hypothetical protein
MRGYRHEEARKGLGNGQRMRGYGHEEARKGLGNGQIDERVWA